MFRADELLTLDLIDGRSILAHVTANGGQVSGDVRQSARRMMWEVLSVSTEDGHTRLVTTVGTFTLPAHVRVKALRPVIAEHGEYVLR